MGRRKEISSPSSSQRESLFSRFEMWCPFRDFCRYWEKNRSKVPRGEIQIIVNWTGGNFLLLISSLCVGDEGCTVSIFYNIERRAEEGGDHKKIPLYFTSQCLPYWHHIPVLFPHILYINCIHRPWICSLSLFLPALMCESTGIQPFWNFLAVLSSWHAPHVTTPSPLSSMLIISTLPSGVFLCVVM